jgi:hypothetical protein
VASEPVTVKVKGIRQLESGAARLFDNIDQAADDEACEATAGQTAATVRARVPRLTGRLAASVRETSRVGGGHSVQMGAGLPYARWIEYGGGRGRPYRARGRYLYPTAKRTERALRKHAEQVCKREIRSMRWPKPM